MELRKDSEGFLTTSELIERLSDRLPLDEDDLRILDNRNDTHFSQIVRNLASNRNNTTGLEKQGLALYNLVGKGWKITELGKTIALNHVI